jgi:hypothetical protein
MDVQSLMFIKCLLEINASEMRSREMPEKASDSRRSTEINIKSVSEHYHRSKQKYRESRWIDIDCLLDDIIFVS